jgi:hypothetical protein
MSLKKLAIIIPITLAVLGALYGVIQWRGWTICKEFDAFAQTTQKALENTNDSIKRTNYNLQEVSKGIEFQKLIDELKFVQQQKAKIKDQYIGKPMPQAVRDALIEKELKEKELQIKIDNFYKAPLPGTQPAK